MGSVCFYSHIIKFTGQWTFGVPFVFFFDLMNWPTGVNYSKL